MSILNYGITVWGGSSTKQFNRLFILQKKAIRHITGAKYNSHTEPIFKKMNLLTLADSYKLKCCNILYKKQIQILHPYHSNLLELKKETQLIITRQSFDVVMSKCTKFQQANNLVFKVGYSWNSLPYEIKSTDNITEHTFSKNVKAHYISMYKETCTIRNCYICKKMK